MGGDRGTPSGSPLIGRRDTGARFWRPRSSVRQAHTTAFLLVTVAVAGMMLLGSSAGHLGPPTGARAIAYASTSRSPSANSTYCGVLGPNPGNASDTAPEYYPNVTRAWYDLCVVPIFNTTLADWGGLYYNASTNSTRSHNLTIGESNAGYETNGTPWKYNPAAQANFVVSWAESCLNNSSLNCWRESEWQANLSSYDIVGPLNTSTCDCGGNQNVTNSGAFVTITFFEHGLPNDTNWSVTINGSDTFRVPAPGAMEFNLPPGTYTYAVSAVAGFEAVPTSGHVQLVATATAVTINFSAQPTTPSHPPWGLAPPIVYVLIGGALGVGVAAGLALYLKRRRTVPAGDHPKAATST
jgi:hypothetical protein